MSLIAIVIIIVVVIALLIYGVDQVPQLAPFAGLIKLLIILGGVLVILNKAGIV